MTDGLDFDEYVTANGRALERYAYVLTGQVQSAQDLAQTALIKAYRRWRRISRVEHPDAYVRRIVTNCYLDQRRRRSDSEYAMADVGSSGAVGAEVAGLGDPAEGVAVRDQLIRALDRLSPHQRAVIVLRHFLGLDDAAIARELGCSPTTVRSHATRGLHRMRTAMAGPETVPEAETEHGAATRPGSETETGSGRATGPSADNEPAHRPNRRTR